MHDVVSGDLAFLPSDLTLLQFSPDKPSKAPQKWTRVLKPTHVLVLEDNKDTPYYLVLYNGERWSAPRSKVYLSSRGVS